MWGCGRKKRKDRKKKKKKEWKDIEVHREWNDSFRVRERVEKEGRRKRERRRMIINGLIVCRVIHYMKREKRKRKRGRRGRREWRQKDRNQKGG